MGKEGENESKAEGKKREKREQKHRCYGMSQVNSVSVLCVSKG
jgi:hypothetical protein